MYQVLLEGSKHLSKFFENRLRAYQPKRAASQVALQKFIRIVPRRGVVSVVEVHYATHRKVSHADRHIGSSKEVLPKKFLQRVEEHFLLENFSCSLVSKNQFK